MDENTIYEDALKDLRKRKEREQPAVNEYPDD